MTIESTRIGQYEVLELLGPGGTGCAYRAKHVATGREVALKIISPELGTDLPEAQQLLQREVSALSRLGLRARGLVLVHEVLIDDDNLVLVRELVLGTPLEEWQRTQRPNEIARVYIEIARALSVLHERGIVVRDLKPSNVIVDSDEQPRIVDYGLAVQIDQPDALTGAGTVVGTVLYMAPEAFTGRRLDTAADVYSFGLMLLEVASGRRMRSGGLAQVATQALHEAPAERLVALRAGPFHGLASELAAMLSREPEKRPSAQQVVEAIDSWREAATEIVPRTAPVATYPVQSLEPVEREPAALPAPRRSRPLLPMWAWMLAGATSALALFAGAGFWTSIKLFEFDSPPEIISMRALASKILAGGDVEIEVNAEDPEHRPLSYRFSTSEGSVTWNAKLAKLHAPERVRSRTIAVRVVVTDPGGHRATEEIAVRVNRPPRGQLLFANEPAPSVPTRVRASIIDPDGDTQRYYWVANPPVVATASKDTVIWTLPSTPGDYEISCKVSDGMERILLRRVFSRR